MDVEEQAEAGPVMRPGLSVEELAAVRELALRAHPDAVPELVGGGSVAEVVASLEPARAAWRRIAAAVGAGASAEVAATAGVVAPAVAAPVVPAGSVPPLALDVEGLPTTEKIRRGLAGRGGR